MKRTIVVTLLLLLSCCACYKPDSPSPRVKTDPVALEQMTRKDCGVTWSLTAGDEAGSGLFVTGAFPELGEVFQQYPDANKIQGFIQRHSDLLRARENFFGTWCVTSKGDCHAAGPVTCYLDVSRETSTLEEAVRLAKACNQNSVAQLNKGNVKIIDSYAGSSFGNGAPISGESLATCIKARGPK